VIILDTNVVSEFMRSDPEQVVVRWLDLQPANSVWTSAITIYEIALGLNRLAQGTRRHTLERQFHDMLAFDLGGRVLPFNTEAALASGAIGAALQAIGKTVDVRDVMIAGISRSRQATVATRNVADFENACEVINPWEGA